MSGKLGGMEECHLSFIKVVHKHKKIYIKQFMPELKSVFRYILFEIAQ